MINQETLIECKIEKFSYERNTFSLSGIDIDVDEKDFISVIGRNGSGKSTLVKILSGILLKYSGSIQYLGKEISAWHKKELAKRISYLPQSGVFIDENMLVNDFLFMGRYAYKKYSEFSFSQEDKKVVEASIRETGITDLKNLHFFELSGGQKQKVLIALSLVQLDISSDLSGKILIIDEPLTYLDVNYQYEIFSLLRKLNKEQNLSVMVVTHDLNLALKFSNKTVLMEEGKTIKYGNTAEIISEDTLKKHFLINSRIVNFENEPGLNYIANNK